MTQRGKILAGVLGGAGAVVLLGVLSFRAGADSAGRDVAAADSDPGSPRQGAAEPSTTEEGTIARSTTARDTTVRDTTAPAKRSWIGRVLGSTPAALTVPAGSEVPVELAVAIDSSDVRNGDGFEVLLSRDLAVGGKVVARAGSRGSGRVVEIDRAGRVKGRERLVLSLDSLEIDGRQHTLQATPVTLVGEGGEKKDAAVIGGVAAVGAIVGAIAGGGKGAAEGAAIGGAGGTGVVLSTRGPDIDLPAGHRLTFRLAADLALVPLS